MARTTERTTRNERRESARAVKAAKKANAETRKLASSLPQPTRGKLEAVAASERTQLDLARKTKGASPRAVTRSARRSAIRLERAAARLGPRNQRRSTSADPKQRAGSLKRQRKQVKQAKSMGVITGVRTFFTAVMTPSDKQQNQKIAKRRARRVKLQQAR